MVAILVRVTVVAVVTLAVVTAVVVVTAATGEPEQVAALMAVGTRVVKP